MDLQEFVAQTLIQISEGVSAAQAKKGGKIAPRLDIQQANVGRVFFTEGRGLAYLVSFDVAVTVTDKGTTGGKAGIEVMSAFALAGEKSKTTESSSASRVQFEVPISYDGSE